jgi:hypothetical protein
MVTECKVVRMKKQKRSRKLRERERQRNNNESDGHGQTSHALNAVHSNGRDSRSCDSEVRTSRKNDPCGSLNLSSLNYHHGNGDISKVLITSNSDAIVDNNSSDTADYFQNDAVDYMPHSYNKHDQCGDRDTTTNSEGHELYEGCLDRETSASTGKLTRPLSKDASSSYLLEQGVSIKAGESDKIEELESTITVINESEKNVTVLPPKDPSTTSRTPEEYVEEKKSGKELAGLLCEDCPSSSLQSNQQLIITATGAQKCIISENIIASTNRVPVLRMYGKKKPKLGAIEPIDFIAWLERCSFDSRSTSPKLLEERGTETQNDKDTATDITR